MRPAARWQSESASEPMIRRRYGETDDAPRPSRRPPRSASPRRRGSRSRSFGSSPSSGVPFEQRALAARRRPLLAGAEVVDEAEVDVVHRVALGDGDREREEARCRASRSASRRSDRRRRVSRPSPMMPTSSETIVRSSSPSKRARITRLGRRVDRGRLVAALRRRPTTGSRSARVGSSASTPRTSSTAARQSVEPVSQAGGRAGPR